MIHAMQRRSLSVLSNKSQFARRRRWAAPLIESLESRTLLSATLFVTSPDTPTDGTHFQTLQNALAFAGTGDTIVLQPGFSAGNFATTSLNGAVTAGSMFIRTTSALDMSEIVSIGAGTAGDPTERALVTTVTQTLLGDFIIGLATPLQFDHSGSAVNANNPGNGGPSLGIDKSVTITTAGDAAMTLPFNLETWGSTSGVSISEHLFTPSHPAPLPPPPPPVTPPPVIPPVTPASETISITAGNLTTVQGRFNCGSVARFTDSATHKASDFQATIVFSDGITLKGLVVRTFSGAFEVIASRRFTVPANLTFTVNVTSNSGGSGSGQGSVTVNPRVLSAHGISQTTDSQALHNVAVATFTDNAGCEWGQNYTATIVWSDGITTTGVISRNCNGSLTVRASRDLSGPGTITGTVTIATGDGLFSTTTSFTLTIVAPPPPPAPVTVPHSNSNGRR